jgi:hypothetical protein
MSQSVTVSVAIPLSVGSVIEADAEAVKTGSDACDVTEAVGKTISVPLPAAEEGSRIPDEEEAQVVVALSSMADWVLVGAKSESVAVAVSTLLCVEVSLKGDPDGGAAVG